MTTQPDTVGGSAREATRLEALARVAEAASPDGSLDGVLRAITRGVEEAFGLLVVLNLYDAEAGRYVVRDVVGGADELLGTWSTKEAFEDLLDPAHEITRDVYFIPYDAGVPVDRLGAVHTPDHGWAGPGFWHPDDMCMVRMRTSSGRCVGILSVDSAEDQRIPDPATFELLRLFAVVGANAVENQQLSVEIASLESERQMRELREHLEEEVLLRQSLLEIGGRLGAASAAGVGDLFPVFAERMATVVPIKTVTIWTVDVAADRIRAVYHSDPERAESVLTSRFDFGVGATGQAAILRESVIANGAEQSVGRLPLPDEAPDLREHVLAVPVMVEEEVKVVLTLRREVTAPPFTQEDARRAELFAQHAAAAFLLIELAGSRRLLAEKVEQLERLNRYKDDFVARASHELRTPLTAVIGNVMTVAGLGDMLGAVERRELLVAAERQARRLGELLENLLAESRLSGDDPALNPVEVDVRAFVDEVADTLRSRAPGRDVVARVTGRPVIVTDRTLLYRILSNLGDNALKYSDGPVRLAAREADDGVRFDVVDRGIGIEQGEIASVFDRFSQVDPTDHRGVGGVGLGLHLVRQAAMALSGRVDVDSRIGEGSTFRLWLPRTVVPSDRPEPR